MGIPPSWVQHQVSQFVPHPHSQSPLHPYDVLLIIPTTFSSLCLHDVVNLSRWHTSSRTQSVPIPIWGTSTTSPSCYPSDFLGNHRRSPSPKTRGQLAKTIPFLVEKQSSNPSTSFSPYRYFLLIKLCNRSYGKKLHIFPQFCLYWGIKGYALLKSYKTRLDKRHPCQQSAKIWTF